MRRAFGFGTVEPAAVAATHPHSISHKLHMKSLKRIGGGAAGGAAIGTRSIRPDIEVGQASWPVPLGVCATLSAARRMERDILAGHRVTALPLLYRRAPAVSRD